MVYAENSLHYWRNLFRDIGVRQGMLAQHSMAEIMSGNVEISEHGQRPLVKVYTARRLRRMFAGFRHVRIAKRQMVREELPRHFGWFPLGLAGRLAGWNLIVKARKPRTAAVQPRQSGLDRALAKAGLDYDGWLARRRLGARLYTEEAAPHLAALAARMPDAVRGTIAAAEGFLAHRFDLLGSGEFAPHDPERPARDGYRPIDWYLDPVRGLRFPRGVPHKEWDLSAMRPGNADVKYPWELARCQHWMTLAQAWRLSRDPRFAVEIARQLDDFVEANPVGFGVNWTCTMDVAIRAANWALALALLHDCEALDRAFWRRAHTALFAHGEFIRGNLEDKYEVTSNHFLSNVVGLYVLAAEFADLADWTPWCRQALETEMSVQVHAEGSDFEFSVPYHRLVTELFLAGARLARSQGAPLGEAYEARLIAMVEFGLAVTRPDGRMPMIGDADDGRFHVFTRPGSWDPQDARHLLAPAAGLLGRPEWLGYSGEAGAWEAAWWGFGVDPAPARELPPAARLFPEIGIAVARSRGNYLAVTNGKVGTKGFGNHKHNELLGFEYHCGGPVIVDPGSYVYTGDVAARNRFRGTAGHSTLKIDSVEQNEINPEWLFRMFEKAEPEHLSFTERGAEDGEWVEYRGRHHGYERLPQPVTHERHFRFCRANGLLLITDRVEGDGAHDLAWHFHLAPGVEIAGEAPGRFVFGNGVVLTYDSALSAAVEAGWYSPSYGVRIPALTLALAARADIPAAGTAWHFALGPEAAVRAR